MEATELERLQELEMGMAEATVSVVTLSTIAAMHARELSAYRRRQAWWNRAFVLVALLVMLRLLTACGGAPFETSSRDGSQLAGAQSSAGAQSAGSAAALFGGAGGVAGGNTAGNSAGSAGDPPSVLGGAGGVGGASVDAGAGGVESGGAPAIYLPCDTRAWKASAFASRLEPAEPPELAVDGNAQTRWSSGEPREAGQWFALELGAGVVLEQLELANAAAPPDLPSSLVLELDGRRVPSVVTVDAGGVRIAFAPTGAASVRLVLTSSAPNWWSIEEIGGLCQ